MIRENGFSLVEVLAAMLLLTVSMVSLSQLLAASTRAVTAARSATGATVLAMQKMEQLRALTWTVDSLGQPASDLTTDTSEGGTAAGCPPSISGGGGTGLSTSPSGSLRRNMTGWVDYLDRNGCLLGGGASAPAGTAYVRRWSVQPLAATGGDTLVIQAVAIRSNGRVATDPGPVGEKAHLVSLKTRTAR